jgi:hypothetical protein
MFNEIVKGLPFSPSNPDDISIVQIRFGSAKGILSAWSSTEDLHRSDFSRCEGEIIL